jgi:hypothetical protein
MIISIPTLANRSCVLTLHDFSVHEFVLIDALPLSIGYQVTLLTFRMYGRQCQLSNGHPAEQMGLKMKSHCSEPRFDVQSLDQDIGM